MTSVRGARTHFAAGWTICVAIALSVLGVATACGGSVETTASPSPGGAPFQEAWGAYDRLYPFLTIGAMDWSAVGARYRDSVAAAPTDRERARLLGAMIGTLHDYHGDLTTPFGTFGPPPIAYAHHFDAQLVQRSYLAAPLASTLSGAMLHARLRAGPGYLYLRSFQPVNGRAWGDEIERVLSELGDISSLVIDIRDNGGGDEPNAQLIAARCYDRTRPSRVSRYRSGPGHDDLGEPMTTSLSPSGTRRFAGPVALLTNRFDGSSAEDFVLMLRALPQVAVVGDTTLGLGSNPLHVTVGNGWELGVPHSIQATPAGFVYQWLGLPPDVAVPWSAAGTAAGRDPCLDAAITALARRGAVTAANSRHPRRVTTPQATRAPLLPEGSVR